jgi:hypothetical protein
MRRKHSTAIAFASILSVAALGSTLSAQYEKGTPSPSPAAGRDAHDAHDRTRPMEPSTRPMEPAPSSASSSARGMSLTAVLVDPEAKARKQAATVKVTTRGVRIVDPALSGEKPIRGQGHLHYQVDDGPVVATTALKLSFHGLKSGAHTIAVALAANDHTPLGPEQKLSVTIP